MADTAPANTLTNRWSTTLIYIAWVLIMACFFSEVEIQIEGASGWAAKLPTWRIESHWLLDIFWGGRPMTGYHAWVFSFMALVFFMPLAFAGRWNGRDAWQALAGLMLFWMIEDMAWFVFNPAFGWTRFVPENVPWHKHWLFGVPIDYWAALVGATIIFGLLNRRRAPRRHVQP